MAKKKKETKKIYIYSRPNGIEGFYGIPARDVTEEEAKQKGIVKALNASPFHELKEV